jgi:hypothetical protein
MGNRKSLTLKIAKVNAVLIAKVVVFIGTAFSPQEEQAGFHIGKSGR